MVNLASKGVRSPDRPPRSQSLYRLRYPPYVQTVKLLVFGRNPVLVSPKAPSIISEVFMVFVVIYNSVPRQYLVNEQDRFPYISFQDM